MNPRVIKIPQFRPLVLRVPLSRAVAEGIDPLLRARLLFVAPSTAKRRIEVVMPESIEQGLCLQQAAATLGVECNRVGADCNGSFIPPHQQDRKSTRLNSSHLG